MAAPVGEKQPVPWKDAYLDTVFSIFKARQHPFVLVEEAALGWMGLRVSPREDLDLLIRDSEMQVIQADLLATGQFDLVEQNLDLRLSDTYAQQVPRLKLKTDDSPYKCISLWSERVYMLDIDGDKIEVPDPQAWNTVIMEERFDIHPSWAQAPSIGYTARIADGIRVIPPILAQSPEMKYPIYIPTIPRMLDALLDQARYRVTHPEEFPYKYGNRPWYHISNFVRYLHLEKPQQRERLLPELADRNREDMEERFKRFKRKPLLTLASLQSGEV